MGELLGPEFPKHLILAVSGGGDSMAMLYLAAPWARVMGIRLFVCTVNHNLRPEAAEEAALVAKACGELGLFHQVLDWHWDGQGNLQDAARQGRIDVIQRWRGSIEHVVMAHTLDDQAETFVMRLARGSGVDGLAGMAPKRALPMRGQFKPECQHPDGPPWSDSTEDHGWLVRPLLAVSRDDLRHYLKTLRIPFADDPSNDDTRFDRIKVRKAWADLERLGLTRERLAVTAGQMARAREVLENAALQAHQACLAKDEQYSTQFDVVYDRDLFAQQPREIQLRLLAAALRFVSGAGYPPRLSALENALERGLGGAATTLHGGYVLPQNACLFVCAEYEKVKDIRTVDGFWRHFFVGEKDVRPLGEAGAAQIRGLSRLPARVLWPAPAVWDGDRVLATPRLGPNAHWYPETGAAKPEHFLSAH
ncbi:tRNA lysidine(34) synthetase TilS [Shimia ponticola]|uniref:tRNA lysidine(34) synthetase TilS n=1 Tax=Shimia ponticola TaxID=2582893 RepID=UPI0011BE5968|nr:tRNA lysidine(34) synthetase TilS [Shimia ponticola]